MSIPDVSQSKATWDDFKDSLEALEDDGTVEREVPDGGDEVCVLSSASGGGGDDNSKRKRSAEIAQDRVDVKAKKAKKATAQDAFDASNIIELNMEVPGRFIPFLLRQSGRKLENIETNTKTRIQVLAPATDTADDDIIRDARTPGTKLPSSFNFPTSADAGGGEGAATEQPKRALTIKGKEEKHLKGAQILIQKMLDAFNGVGYRKTGA